MTYLVDADWVIDALTGHRNATSVLTDLAPRGIAISAVTVAEIYEGAFRSPNPAEHLRLYRGLLGPFRRLAISDPVAERFAELRAFLRHRGQMIPDFDLLVATTALEHDLTVLTQNLVHFQRSPDLRIYRTW